MSYHSGLQPEAPIIIIGSSLSLDDETSEVTEGFVLYIDIDESTLDPRDANRISVVNSVVLVLITDNDSKCAQITVKHFI